MCTECRYSMAATDRDGTLLASDWTVKLDDAMRTAGEEIAVGIASRVTILRVPPEPHAAVTMIDVRRGPGGWINARERPGEATAATRACERVA